MQETFLLSKANKFKLSEMEMQNYTYDENSGLNIITENGVKKVAVMMQCFSPTHSKTMAWPGDDDPDEGRCY
ncbi:hypothetical protein [Desulfosporosinus sp. FKA]|uniref:hypothetical protein n=1 Tax=Desulfosporosinus sp. FKA TaxID=1969834 RepID=UPI000B49E5F6|nr:hypothetical protein [Desulfosporosinus sp. FKA]